MIIFFICSVSLLFSSLLDVTVVTDCGVDNGCGVCDCHVGVACAGIIIVVAVVGGGGISALT